MKLSWSFLASSLCCTAAAARPSVSPDTARLILAQRLGLSQFHSLEHADAEAIRHINAFGGARQELFKAHGGERVGAHLLMWVEGVDEQDATVVVSDGVRHTQDFKIANPPSPAENDRLLKDLISQAESLPKEAHHTGQTHGLNTFEQVREFNAIFAPEHQPQVHNGYLSVLRIQKDDKKTHRSLESMLKRVAQMDVPQGSSFTVVMMPASSSHSKRAANPWGTYDLPASNEARRQNPEALLSAGPEPASSPAPPVSDLEDFPVIINQAKPKAPVRGILPSCFNTLSSCQKTTNNCTGHGECKLLHKGRGSGKDQQTVDCYGCACSPTVQHVGEDKGMESKRKVTYWGGPACQKKDISVQFWLFVGSGVILAFLVASGIGMLYSMGSEELPSVIGAGVSGPARK